MSNKINLDVYEQDIEDNFASLNEIIDEEEEISRIKKVAKLHAKRKKSITLRINEIDLETLRIKASKLGIPYQTYINMLIHIDATAGL